MTHRGHPGSQRPETMGELEAQPGDRDEQEERRFASSSLVRPWSLRQWRAGGHSPGEHMTLVRWGRGDLRRDQRER